ncbi:biotin transporter BioY [Shimazuella sp. AN120528]|uniref:biotin transporter BioY n=1 Tax=Shimazuella soli TaxID=1892854 RepID=UPI001F0DB613|nr:biotin transporter BioY [Shimazuella soli]MCH5583507.1 biotin transporter BioY [Shimazuella soli]
MSSSSILIRNMVLAALFAALIAISGQIAIPIGPVPITLQTMMVLLAGSILGSRWGAISVLVWILLAAVGAPVLSGGTGGIGVLLGATGGYIFGFLLAAFLVGWVIERLGRNKQVAWWQLLLVFLFVGDLVTHVIGFSWFLYVSHFSFSMDIFNKVFVVFLPGDIAKAILATILTVALYRAIPSFSPQERMGRSK